MLNGPVKTKGWSMWLPPNNTFVCQCNLFAYDHKYMPTHSPVCCQSPGMILMRNINGRCPENMLVLVTIAYWSMVAAILFNFCGRWLNQTSNVRCAVANYSNKSGSLRPEKLHCWFDITDKVDQSGLRIHSCSVDMITSQVNSFITPKRCFSKFLESFFLQIPSLFQEDFFSNSQFSW